jgi:hypothetical protein
MYRLFLIFMSIQFSALSAPFDLNNPLILNYAEESIQASDINSDRKLVISSASDTLNLAFLAGFGISVQSRYIRLDVINGAFNTNFPLSGLAASADYTTNLSAGGGVGDTFLIVEVYAPSAIGADTSFVLESDSFIWFNKNAPLKIQYTLYDSASDAVNQGRYLSRTDTDIAIVTSAVGKNFTVSFTHSVGFTQDFLRFTSTFRTPSTFGLGDSNGETASLGKVLFERLITDDVLLPSTSVAITDFRLLIPEEDTSFDSVIISGDFSTVRAFLNSDDDCTGTSVELAEFIENKNVVTSIDALFDHPVLCVVAESNIITLNRTAYQLDLGIGLGSSLFGEVTYDAASIDLPYVTNFGGYRQRIMLVNHAGYDVAYTTRFVSEEGVGDSFSIGEAAEGIISAGTTLKLNAEDLVTIDSNVSSRISARIFVDAKPADISAAVQILSIGSDAPPQTNVLQVLEY